MQQKPTSFSAILPAAWTTTPLAFPAAFWKAAESLQDLPALRAALTAHQLKHTMNSNIENQALAA